MMMEMVDEPGMPLRTPAHKEQESETADHKFVEAVKNKNYEGMSAALEQGADINAAVEESRYHSYSRHGSSNYTHRSATTLFYALDKQDQKLLEFLVAHGADVNRLDENNTSALTIAVCKEHKPFIKAVASAPCFDRLAEGNKAALQAAEGKKHGGPAPKELYQYVKSIISDPWQLVDDQIVSRVSFDKDGMLEVTDQFNFKAGERIRHIRDFEFGAVQTTSLFFADMPANMRAQLKEAWDALKAAGGGQSADPQSVNARRLHRASRRNTPAN